MAYEVFIRLLNYPRDGYAAAVARDGAPANPELNAEAARLLAAFAAGIHGLSTEELEELYCRTFEINPLCSLEVGWQLFGENYDRGRFLVFMRQELRRLALPESAELPDHLTHVLAMLERTEPERAEKLAAECVLPAIGKMLDGLGGKSNPYEDLLKAITQEVQNRHAPVVEGARHA